MKKRFLSLSLAVLFCILTTTSCSAADVPAANGSVEITQIAAENFLVLMSIVQGRAAKSDDSALSGFILFSGARLLHSVSCCFPITSRICFRACLALGILISPCYTGITLKRRNVIMQNWKKVFALLLAVIMVLSLAACGGKASNAALDTPSEPAPEVTEAPAQQEPETDPVVDSEAETPEVERPVISYPLFDDVQTFTLWTSSSPDLSEIISDLNMYLVFAELEKVTNISWDATLVSFFSSTEQFQLMVASQEYTDVVCRALESYTGGVDHAIEEEFLIDHSTLIEENMPNLLGWFDTYPELKKQMSSVEGNIGGFPKIYKEPSDVNQGGCIRRDWLEELGLDAPATYDELHDILVQFKDKKNAVAPLVLSMQNGVQPDLLNGMNIGSGFYQVDGEVRFGPMQPEYKEFLAMMNSWYNEGLLSDSFLASQAEVLLDNKSILRGETGVWYGTGVQSIAQLLTLAGDTQPGMSITGITYVTKDGSKAHVGDESAIMDSIIWSITTECEDPGSIASILTIFTARMAFCWPTTVWRMRPLCMTRTVTPSSPSWLPTTPTTPTIWR